MIEELVKCPHKQIYIIGIEQQDEELKGQYWFNCVNPNCLTTGISPLKGYKENGEIVNEHFMYERKQNG